MPSASARPAAIVVASTHGSFGKLGSSDHDAKIAGKIAYVLTGGDISAPAWVDPWYILDLEREAFLSLLGEEKTRERMMHMLQTGKPLRN